MPPQSDIQKAAAALRNARRKYEALPKTAEIQPRMDALYAWNDFAKEYFSKRADEFLGKNENSANNGNSSYAESTLNDLAEHHAAVGQAARQLGVDPRTLVPPFIKLTQLQASLHEKESQIASALRIRFIEVGLPTYGFDEKSPPILESRWFILGCILLLFALAFVIWGFSLGTLTWDQQRLLVWALPLASGFSAAAFAGSIYTQARDWIPGIAITATGGFAVWFITFFFLFPGSKVQDRLPVLTPKQAEEKKEEAPVVKTGPVIDTSWHKTGPISGFSATDYPSGLMVKGQWKTFGGPDDQTRRSDEGLSLVSEADIPFFSSVLLPNQPAGTTGLIKRLDPTKYYIACHWDSSMKSSFLKRGEMAKVSNVRTGKTIKARPVDYGPASFTNCVADISPGLKDFLGLQGADEISVEVPVPK
jgi:hypothetical protein